jgi:trehalose-6-phosphatase
MIEGATDVGWCSNLSGMSRVADLSYASPLPAQYACADSTPHWKDHWPEISAAIPSDGRLLLVLDCDRVCRTGGVARREATSLKLCREALRDFAAAGGRLAFLSAQPLRELRDQVGLEEAFYAGDQGMQIRGPGYACAGAAAAGFRGDLVDALVFLKRCARHLQNISIEDRRYSVAIRQRNRRPTEEAVIRELLETIAARHPNLAMTARADGWELCSCAALNKWQALQKILQHLRFTPPEVMCVASAMEGAEVFASIEGGLTFCVGGHSSHARYRIDHAADEAEFLQEVSRRMRGE